MCDGEPAFMLHGADGTPLVLAGDVETAVEIAAKQRSMSTDAGTEEHRVSGTLLPMPRRTPQLPSLPVPDAAICSCGNTALAAYAQGGNCPPYPGHRLSR
jgi:hypothetical protein